MTPIAAFTAGACGFVMLAAVAAPVAQSLADVARKEQERRKSIKGPTKVYTNSDLSRYPSDPSVPTPPPTPSATKPATTPDKAKAAAPALATDEPVKDEKYWRERITSVRRDLERNRIFVDALQSRVNALTTDFVNRDDPAQRAVIANDRQKALAEMERVRGEIQRLTTEIAEIDEEARRAGVPPGWLR